LVAEFQTELPERKTFRHRKEAKGHRNSQRLQVSYWKRLLSWQFSWGREEPTTIFFVLCFCCCVLFLLIQGLALFPKLVLNS
jgi:hypothetical protein